MDKENLNSYKQILLINISILIKERTKFIGFCFNEKKISYMLKEIFKSSENSQISRDEISKMTQNIFKTASENILDNSKYIKKKTKTTKKETSDIFDLIKKD